MGKIVWQGNGTCVEDPMQSSCDCFTVGLQVRNVTQETADVFLEYIQRNIPEGVSMKVEQTELESISDYFELPPEAQEFLKQQESNQRKT